MAHSRMAISALLSDSPSATVTARRTSPPMGSPSSSASVARARSPGLQPLQLSLPLTLVRRTPSPPASARPGKRPRSEASPSSRSVRPRLTESASSSSSSNRSTGTATPSTSSSASASATTSGRTSYSNPGFYSIGSGPAAPPRQETPPPPRLADALEPMPLATFASTTNAELRWAESRPSSRAASPAVAELPHGPASTDSALAAGVKFVEDVRASLIGSRTRRASTDQSSRLAYPSSSERDRPLSGHARRRSGSGATSNASGSSDARSPTSSSSRDAHDWLIDHYSSRSPASRPRQPITQRPQNSPRPSPMMASVDDELLDLVDGPPQQQRESAIVRVKPEVRAASPDTKRLVHPLRA